MKTNPQKRIDQGVVSVVGVDGIVRGDSLVDHVSVVAVIEILCPVLEMQIFQ